MKKYKPAYGQPPLKPTEPKQSRYSYKEISTIEIDDYSEFSLPPLNENQFYYFFTDDVEHDRFSQINKYYIGVRENTIVENPNYEKELSNYNKALEIYKEESKIYKEFVRQEGEKLKAKKEEKTTKEKAQRLELFNKLKEEFGNE
jgi:hypothetical protein